MKNKFWTVAIILFTFHLQGYSQNHFDFSAVSAGKTLYYLIEGNSVKVTYPKANSGATNYYVGFAKPVGALVIPDSVVYNGITYAVSAVDKHAFHYCSGLTSVTIPNTVQAVDDSAFYGCSSITEVNLGAGVTEINRGAFQGCSHLPEIVIPSSTISIKRYAFFGCSMLTRFCVHGLTPPVVEGNTLSADTLVVHCAAMPAYQYTFPWNNRFTTVIGFYEDLPRVYDTVTAYCSYTWNGTNYTESVDGVSYTVAQPWFCDTLYILNLTIWDTTYYLNDTLVLCQSLLPYSYANTMIEDNMTSGEYTIATVGSDGCNNIINLNLTVHESEYTELCMVSVADNRNQLVWEKGARVASYNIYREETMAGQYELIAAVPYDTLSVYIDENSHPMTRSYRYRIASVDSCGIESEQSEAHKTMHLTINRGVGDSWNLVWTEYEGAGYSSYQIYRGSNPGNVELIDEMPSGGNTTYTDYDVSLDTVFYQVAIIKDEPCSPTKSSEIIRSNIATNGNMGIDEIILDNIIYPNPTSGLLIIDAEDLVRVDVFDQIGRLVTTYVKTSRIDLSELPAGNYLLKIHLQRGLVFKNIILK